MVDHLKQPTLNPLRVKNEYAEGDKPHVTDAGVSDEFFEIILCQGHIGPVEYGNYG